MDCGLLPTAAKLLFPGHQQLRESGPLHICCQQAGFHQTCLLSRQSDAPSIKCNITDRELGVHRLQVLTAVGSAAYIHTLINYQQGPSLWITLSVRKGTALAHVPISAPFKRAHLSNFQKHWGYVRKPGCRERCTGGTILPRCLLYHILVSLCFPPPLQGPAVIKGFA